MKKLLHLLPCVLVLIFIACNENGSTGAADPECSDPEGDALIRLNYPEGGEEFKVGDKIDIRYSIDVEKAPGAVAFISKDNGKIWDKIVDDESIKNNEKEGYECIIYTWEIPSDFVTESNSKVRAKVNVYGNPAAYSTSDAFTITP